MNRKHFRIWCLILLVLSCFVFMGQSCCTDNDGDGYFADGGNCGELDCNDSNPETNPGADEICDDGIDNDCDLDIDEQDCVGGDDDDDDQTTTTTTVMEDTTTTTSISGSSGPFDTIESIEINMVAIPGGTFEMGCSDGDDECSLDEKPQHTVTISSFNMSAYEVTQGQWEAVMGTNPSYFSSCGSDCPVEDISWYDVQNYITTLNLQTGKSYRLPTEAEWEFAARAGTTTRYYCGDNESCLDDIAWYNDSPGATSHPVGQKDANAWGLYDMSGNVWEWIPDFHLSVYYDESPSTDPQGPESGSWRVIRGGSWGNTAPHSRSSNRFSNSPTSAHNYIGFRLALP